MLKRIKSILLSSASIITFTLSSAVSAEIAIIVSSDSAIKLSSERDIARIYLGKSNKLSGVKVNVIAQDSKLDIVEEFSQNILNMSSNKAQAQWAKLIFTGKRNPPATFNNDEQVIEAVKYDSNAIGYIDIQSVTPDVKVIFKK